MYVQQQGMLQVRLQIEQNLGDETGPDIFNAAIIIEFCNNTYILYIIAQNWANRSSLPGYRWQFIFYLANVALLTIANTEARNDILVIEFINIYVHYACTYCTYMDHESNDVG